MPIIAKEGVVGVAAVTAASMEEARAKMGDYQFAWGLP